MDSFRRIIHLDYDGCTEAMDVLLNIFIAAKADGFLGIFSSNVDRVIAKLMYATLAPETAARTPVWSVDPWPTWFDIISKAHVVVQTVSKELQAESLDLAGNFKQRNRITSSPPPSRTPLKSACSMKAPDPHHEHSDPATCTFVLAEGVNMGYKKIGRQQVSPGEYWIFDHPNPSKQHTPEECAAACLAQRGCDVFVVFTNGRHCVGLTECHRGDTAQKEKGFISGVKQCGEQGELEARGDGKANNGKTRQSVTNDCSQGQCGYVSEGSCASRHCIDVADSASCFQFISFSGSNSKQEQHISSKAFYANSHPTGCSKWTHNTTHSYIYFNIAPSSDHQCSSEQPCLCRMDPAKRCSFSLLP
ncbi:hypothetical protein CYMTET_21590 [Cymbomonas tetramitiformis]|uniref:Uncharacterized protein n=1 Tax=Cymbomonas tetramitiformis TaxID=36881 RepID=A0AAE0L314_9CHLO|nr:hypothetical protein CYMTET_21590 [Cymbomonas tetramitiformis]